MPECTDFATVKSCAAKKCHPTLPTARFAKLSQHPSGSLNADPSSTVDRLLDARDWGTVIDTHREVDDAGLNHVAAKQPRVQQEPAGLGQRKWVMDSYPRFAGFAARQPNFHGCNVGSCSGVEPTGRHTTSPARSQGRAMLMIYSKLSYVGKATTQSLSQCVL